MQHGVIKAPVDTSAPGKPATCQPMIVTTSMFGPGAACAMV